MRKSKMMCSGCYNNYYNHKETDGCWSFKSAKVVKRIKVGIMEKPPYSANRAEKYLSCYRQQGYSFISLDDPRIKG